MDKVVNRDMNILASSGGHSEASKCIRREVTVTVIGKSHAIMCVKASQKSNAEKEIYRLNSSLIKSW